MDTGLHIWFDLDGVLANFHKALYDAIAKQGLPYDMECNPIQRGEEAYRLHDQMVREGGFLQMQPYEASVMVVMALHAQGHHIHYMTARASRMGDPEITASLEQQTRDWLVWHGLPGAENLVVSGDREKSILLTGFDADLLVEDHPETCQDTAKILDRRGLRVTAALLDRPWNREVEHNPRLADIGEVFDLVAVLRAHPEWRG